MLASHSSSWQHLTAPLTAPPPPSPFYPLLPPSLSFSHVSLPVFPFSFAPLYFCLPYNSLCLSSQLTLPTFALNRFPLSPSVLFLSSLNELLCFYCFSCLLITFPPFFPRFVWDIAAGKQHQNLCQGVALVIFLWPRSKQNPSVYHKSADSSSVEQLVTLGSNYMVRVRGTFQLTCSLK